MAANPLHVFGHAFGVVLEFVPMNVVAGDRAAAMLGFDQVLPSKFAVFRLSSSTSP
jgi:hypothetical protein